MSSDPPPKKRRKLPALDDDFSDSTYSDDPSLHQGRKRTVPHVQGQWPCHVYFDLKPSEALLKTLREAYALVSSVPETAPPVIHSLLGPSPTQGTASSTLHLSLSRPLILQTNQRSDLRAGIARLAQGFSSFSARYATFAVLENDDHTRRFLGVEIGTGYSEMKALTNSLDGLLCSLRLPPYYPTPRFHTSLVWTARAADGEEEDPKAVTEKTPFRQDEVALLEEKLGRRLRAEELWVEEVCLRIGKEVVRYRLRG